MFDNSLYKINIYFEQKKEPISLFDYFRNSNDTMRIIRNELGNNPICKFVLDFKIGFINDEAKWFCDDQQ